MKMKKYLLGVIFTNLSVLCFGQINEGDTINSYELSCQTSVSVTDRYEIAENLRFTNPGTDGLFTNDEIMFSGKLPGLSREISGSVPDFNSDKVGSDIFQMNNNNNFMKQKNNSDLTFQSNLNQNLSLINDNFFEKNRRNIYSSMWAFASLNYLYCDVVGLMDKNIHAQYEAGVVDGTEITPQFLTGAAVMMQIAIANVFLPQVIKNDRRLRWVQIASGISMTLIQSATLFVGKPTPYYSTFSAFEIGATTFITINALRWKTNSKKQLPVKDY